MAQTEAEVEFEKFVEFYGRELVRTGFQPDASTSRDDRVFFLQRTLQLYCSPLWMMKRADPFRPISDEAVVWVKEGPEYRRFGDFIVSGGSDAWHLSTHLEGPLPVAQPLVSPLMVLSSGAGTPGYAAEPLPGGVAPTVPGCVSPLPPELEEPLPPAKALPSYEDFGGDESGMKISRVLEADYREAGRPGLDGGCGAWIGRCYYDYIADRYDTVEESIAIHRPEWRRALGLPT